MQDSVGAAGSGTSLVAMLARGEPLATSAEDRAAAVARGKAALDPRDPVSLQRWGQGVYDTLSAFNDDMNSRSAMSEAGDVSPLIKDVILKAQGMDPARLRGAGFIRKLMDRGGGELARFRSRFETASAEIGGLTRDLVARAARLEEDARDLDGIYDVNRAQFEQLDALIEAGREFLSDLRANGSQPTRPGADGAALPFAGQDTGSLKAFADGLDRKILSFETLKADALDTACEILLTQENALVASSNMRGAADVTRQWRKTFRIALKLESQRQAVEITAMVHEADSTMRRRTSELLGQLIVSTARQAEQPAVDVATLEAAQATMIAALDARARIVEQGHLDRVESRRRIAVIEDNVRRRASPA